MTLAIEEGGQMGTDGWVLRLDDAEEGEGVVGRGSGEGRGDDSCRGLTGRCEKRSEFVCLRGIGGKRRESYAWVLKYRWIT